MKTHHNIETGTADEALVTALGYLLADGEEVGSRQGDRNLEILMPRIVLNRPWEREIITSGRKASLPAQIAETMWVLAGRNDIGWLSHYLPRAAQFSDDGETWRGAYGPRLRNWHQTGTDQLAHVVNLLTNERGTRRAVMSIYDPWVDTKSGKDIPCNDFITFISRLGKLHMTVTTRSNDIIWGWSGINQFEWSALQEIVAYLTGNQVGTLTFNITSLHLYERHWGKARDIIGRSNDPKAEPFVDSAVHARFEPQFRTVEDLDVLINQWFEIEERIRKGQDYAGMVEGFSEPMMRSWLRVLQYHWSGNERYLMPIEGTRLAIAARLSPKGKRLSDVRVDPDLQAEIELTELNEAVINFALAKRNTDTRDKVAPLAWTTQFVEYVDSLHREKSAVYGDSWKKRGEQVSILANIARKVDRIGEAGAGDSSADTVIDLLVYLIKYRLWLNEKMDPVAGHFLGVEAETEDDAVRQVLNSEDRACVKVVQRASLEPRFVAIKEYFEVLWARVDHGPIEKSEIVDQMIRLAFPAARLLWGEENGHLLNMVQAKAVIVHPEPLFTVPLEEAAKKARRAVVQEANKGRRWEGYEAGENLD